MSDIVGRLTHPNVGPDALRRACKEMRAENEKLRELLGRFLVVTGEPAGHSPECDCLRCDTGRALKGPRWPHEVEPHHYVPSAMHMGDCAICGHLQGDAIHRREIPPMHDAGERE